MKKRKTVPAQSQTYLEFKTKSPLRIAAKINSNVWIKISLESDPFLKQRRNKSIIQQHRNTLHGHEVKSYRRRQKTVQFYSLETDGNLETH